MMGRVILVGNITIKLLVVIILTFFFVFLSTESDAAPKRKKQVEEPVPSPRMSPWSLRHRYTFSWEDMGIDFDEFNGDWRIFIATPDSYVENTLIEGYGPVIHLESGEIIEGYQIGNAVTEREPIESVFGKGTNFTAVFPSKNGVVVKQRVTTFSNYGFIVFTTSVTNNRTEPITISKIRIIGFPPPGANLQRNISKLTLVPVENISGFWRYTSRDNSQVVEFTSTDGLKHVVFAIAPQGKAKSRIVFSGDSIVGEGNIECDYAPPIRLRPNESIESDPVVVSFGNYYGNLLSNVCWAISGISPLINKNSLSETVRGWISVPSEKATLTNLQKVAEFSKTVGLDYVYIPQGWESPPGSCKGDTRKLSGNMKSVIEALKVGKSFNVGLYFDPWVVPLGSEHSFSTSEGYAIVNYTRLEGVKVAEKRWKKIMEWSIDFLVCGVNIPENILRELNSTNEEALTIAMRELSRYFEKVPIFPSFSEGVITSTESFFEYTNFVSHAYDTGSGVAPALIDCALLTNQDELLHLILRSKPYGWIWVGDFSKNDVKFRLSSLGKSNDIIVLTSCKLGYEIPMWKIKKYSREGSEQSVHLFYLLPSVSKLGDLPILNYNAKKNSKVWDIGESKLVEKFSELNFGSVPYLMLSVIEDTNLPKMIGIKGSKFGGIEDVNAVSWINDEKKMVLSLNSRFTGNEEVVLYVPTSFKVKKIILDKKTSDEFRVDGEFILIKLKPKTETIEILFQ